jgi:hypothetical protein
MEIPDKISLAWILKNGNILRDALRFSHQVRNIDVIQNGGNIKRIKVTPKSLNSVLDLRDHESGISTFTPPTGTGGPPVPDGLQQWLDASAVTAVSSGDTIGGGLVDLTGNGWNIVSTTGSPRWIDAVTNGWPGVELNGGFFGGLNKGLNNPYAVTATDAPLSIAFACRSTGRGFRFINPTPGGGTGGWTLGPGPAFIPYGSEETDSWAFNAASSAGGGVLLRDNAYLSVVLTRAATGTWNMWARDASHASNGVEHTSPGNLSFGGATLSTEPLYGFSGYFHESFAWSRDITTAERDTMFAYFNAKWGTTRPPRATSTIPTEFPDPGAEQETETEAGASRILVSRTGRVLVSSTGHVLMSRV